MLRRQAANWLARLQSGRDPEAERKFSRWYSADPAHAEAFERVRRSYEQAGLLRQSPIASAPMPGAGERKPSAARLNPRYNWAAAAALAILVPAALLAIGRGISLGGTNAVMLVTRVGEIRRVALDDGSRVTLDTATSLEIQVRGGRRRALLNRGRARFEIARGDGPFVIQAGSTVVSSAHAIVDVERSGPQASVEVRSGTADVRGAGQSAVAELTLAAGEGARPTATAALQKHGLLPGPDWTRGMLEFDATPLGSAVALANRYSARQIIVEENLDQLRVTGAFRAGDTTGLAKALAEAFRLSLEKNAQGDLVLSRPSSAARKKNGG